MEGKIWILMWNGSDDWCRKLYFLSEGSARDFIEEIKVIDPGAKNFKIAYGWVSM